MKKFFLLILVLALGCFAAAACGETAAEPATETYLVEAMGCRIPVVEGWYPYHASLTEEELAEYGVTREAVEAYLEQRRETLFILDENGEFQLIVGTFDAEVDMKLEELDDDMLDAISGAFIPAREESYGIGITKYEWVRTATNAYLRYESTLDVDGKTYYGVTYFTVRHGDAYDFGFGYYDRYPDEEILAKYADFIENIIWE